MGHIAYGWDLPLVDIDWGQLSTLPTLETIKEAVMEQAVCRVKCQTTCPHLTTADICSFVRTGVCESFQSTDCIIAPTTRCMPQCGRKVFLHCTICGGMYFWCLNFGQICLSYRYYWQASRPASPGWIFLLDRNTRERVFKDDTKHILWCDTPSCHTNKLHRWEVLVRRDARRDHCERTRRAPDGRGGNRGHAGLRIVTDYEAMCQTAGERPLDTW